MAKKHRILFFDDDTDILELCSVILQRRNYEVFTSTTCLDLFNTISSVQPDVIFMDNWIPGIGGLEATRQIKSSHYAHIPVIYFSANNDVSSLAQQAGADTYLAKPFDIAALEHIITDVLANNKTDQADR